MKVKIVFALVAGALAAHGGTAWYYTGGNDSADERDGTFAGILALDVVQ